MGIYNYFEPVELESIKSIVAACASECFGVVAMSSKNTADGIVTIFRKDKSTRGVKLSADEDGSLMIYLYVVMEYGVRTKAVAENLIDTVKYCVENRIGCRVKRVEVNVVGLRMSKEV